MQSGGMPFRGRGGYRGGPHMRGGPGGPGPMRGGFPGGHHAAPPSFFGIPTETLKKVVEEQSGQQQLGSFIYFTIEKSGVNKDTTALITGTLIKQDPAILSVIL